MATKDIPTDRELAAALIYIDNEFATRDRVTGEMWAEGLAFGRPYDPREGLLKFPDVDPLQLAKEMRVQLPESAWQQIGERATRMAFDQGQRGVWDVRGRR